MYGESRPALGVYSPFGRVKRGNSKKSWTYQTILKYYRDLKNVTDTAFDEGLLEGRLEGEVLGIEKGREEGAHNMAPAIARHLKALGLPDAQIAQVTGLSAENVAAA